MSRVLRLYSQDSDDEEDDETPAAAPVVDPVDTGTIEPTPTAQPGPGVRITQSRRGIR